MKDDNGPRLIGRIEAAAYCGISPTSSSVWVSTGRMPPAIPGTKKWDKRAIDAKLDEISGLNHDAGGEKETDLQKWRRERDVKRAAAAKLK